MDDNLFYTIIVLGSVIAVVSWFIRRKRNQTFDLKQIISCFLTTGGIVGGLLVMAACIMPSLMKHISEVKLYMFIAGVAVVYVSAHSMYTELFK